MSVSVPDAAPIPDSYTPVSKAGAVLIDALAPFMTEHLAWYLDAIGAMIDPLYVVAMDVGTDDGDTPTIGTTDSAGDRVQTGYQPGYGSIFNPYTVDAADAGYLGNYVGVTIPAGTDLATAQSLLTSEQGQHRGTDAAVIAAAKRNLTGAQSVFLVRRAYVDGSADAGWFQIVVRPEEVVNEAQLVADVNAVKLNGLGWTLVQSDAPLLSQYTLPLGQVSVPIGTATLADVT